MSKAKKADTDQRQFWQMVLETFKSSGLSVRQFCKQEGLSEPSFYSWRKRLTNPRKPDVSKEQPHPESKAVNLYVDFYSMSCLEVEISHSSTARLVQPGFRGGKTPRKTIIHYAGN